MVGGGPAGAILATLCAQNGLEVALYERERAPPYRVGKSLLPATPRQIVPLLGAADEMAQADLVVKPGGTFSWGDRPGDPWDLIFAGHTALNVDRQRFDAVLLANAGAKGVAVHEGEAVRSVGEGDAEQGRVVEVEALDTGARRRVQARYVANASGQRRLDLPGLRARTWSRIFSRVAVWGYWDGAGRLAPPLDGNVFFETLETAHGPAWVWFIPLSDTLTSVGVVAPRGCARALGKNRRTMLSVWLAQCPRPPRSLAPDRERPPVPPAHAAARNKCHNRPMRFFNTEGPVRPDDHYGIPPLERMDVEELLGLIRGKRYFVLHAPRQTGKTSALIALRDLLNSGEAGDFRCVSMNVEPAQVARDDVARGIRAILSGLATRARLLGDDYPDGVWPDVLANAGPEDALKELLTRWCVANPVPLVLLVDEIDSLVGDTLLSVLRQLRAGYEQRPEGFPQSVVLCGVRDIRDYRIRSSTGEIIAGGSPFNVAAKSLRMGDFTEAETRALMAQHTEETGQRFTAAAVDSVWTQTRGQPWLVNALCAGACFDNKAGRDRSRSIDVDDVYAAREELILSRRTHLDQLAHKLEEERVRQVVEPILSGGEVQHDGRDLEYVRDLGLLAPDSPPRMANPIYREVVPRELGYVLQDSLDIQARWYVGDDSRLDMTKLLSAFRTFFGEHAEHWLGHLGAYREAAPQLILQSYLQRVVNGGGRIEREYGLGRGRTDLLVLWPREAGQPSDLWERFVVECKVLRDSDRKSLAWTVEKGVRQTLGYMAQCGAEEGHLVVMDRRSEERRGGETRRHGDGEADGSERRQDGCKVVVWTLWRST